MATRFFNASSLALSPSMPMSAPPAIPSIPTKPAEGELVDEEPLVDISAWVRESPPWLASALIHMLVVLLLGVLWVSRQVEQPLQLHAEYAEEIGEQLLEEPFDLDVEPELEVEEQAISFSTLPEVMDPIAAPELTLAPPTEQSINSSTAQLSGSALTGREPGMKAALLKAYGGSETTEKAVLDALRWLARNQKPNGLWSLKGPYRDGGTTENYDAATAMALLAFQGAGYTHQDPSSVEFSRNVSRGWSQLLKSQDEEGNFYQGESHNHAIYSHAQCTIAICELYAMTQDESLREPAQRAVDYCVKAQSKSGGWRYEPRRGADTSVTGWVVMALKSAQMAGLDVPSEVFYKVGKYMDSVAQNDGSRYAYQPRGLPTLSMTAEGLLCRQYLGWSRDDPRLREGVYYLLENLPRFARGKRNVYYWYYATQVCHHMEGEEWDKWNAVTRQLLPKHQEKKGRDRGSWDPVLDERHGDTAGRLYTTCLSVYILEVYYRHLPLYRQGLLTSF